jgi:hypothetical protein
MSSNDEQRLDRQRQPDQKWNPPGKTSNPNNPMQNPGQGSGPGTGQPSPRPGQQSQESGQDHQGGQKDSDEE